MRVLLERLTGGLRIWRRLPRAFARAPVLMSSAAGLKFLYRSPGQIDPVLLRNACELVRPGDVVWDLGANVGMFSVAAAALAGSAGAVYAFEPDPTLVCQLHRTARAQPATHAPLHVIPLALGDDRLLRQFQIAARSRAANHLPTYGSSQTGGIRDQIWVASASIDALLARGLIPAPDVLKLDVEGAEAEVLLAAERLWSHCRPLLLAEISSEAQPAVDALLARVRYRSFDAEQPLDPSQAGVETHWNTIAIPAERIVNGQLSRATRSAARAPDPSDPR